MADPPGLLKRSGEVMVPMMPVVALRVSCLASLEEEAASRKLAVRTSILCVFAVT